MAGLQGVVGEYKGGSVVITEDDRLIISLDEAIDYLNTDKNLFSQLLTKLPKKSVNRMQHSWLTQARKADFVANTAVGGNWDAGAADDGTLTVAAGDAWLFSAGDIISIPSVDDAIPMYVNSVVQATGVITAETVDGTTIDLSAAGADTANIFLISNSFESGSGVGTIKSEQPTKDSNYIQITQTPMGMTTTAMKLAYRGPKEWDKLKFESGVDHMFKKEKTFFYGMRERKAAGLMDGVYEQWFTGGLIDFISDNVKDAGGALTQTEFSDWVIDFTQYGKKPLIFAGDLIFEGLTKWSESKLEIQRTEDTLGMSVSKYLTPYGDLVGVIPHRELLTGDLGGQAFGVDMTDLQYLYLEGLDDHIVPDVQTPGDKQKIDELRTWFGLKVGNQKKHGHLFGATSITV